MSKWIEHIDNGDGTPLCDKGKSNRDIVNDVFCDVDPEVICSYCKKELARLIVQDFGSVRAVLESSECFRLFKVRSKKL